MRRPLYASALLVVAVLAALGLATPASAATLTKEQVVANFTQPTTASRAAWLDARDHQSQWTPYGLDWSTDYCSDSPDQPLGFDFRLGCARHDFGYRNYTDLGTFAANKSRLDSMLYFDLRATCATYPGWEQPSCNSLAWTYYQAVKTFGSVRVSDADLRHAAALRDSAAARL